MPKSSTLDAIAPATKTLDLSIGTVTIEPFKLGQIRKCSHIIADLMRSVNFKSIQAIKETLDINIDELAFTIFGDEMQRTMLLMHHATGKDFEALDTLSADEAMDLITAISEVCIMPVAKSLGKRIATLNKKGEGSPATGAR